MCNEKGTDRTRCMRDILTQFHEPACEMQKRGKL